MDNEEENINAFLKQIEKQSIFPDCIRQAGKRYEINAGELIKVPPEEILRLRSIIMGKIKGEPEFKQRLEVEWNECEKKIFNWVAICFARMNAKNLQDLSDEDLDYLSSITTGKSLPLIRYHICTLVKQEGRPKWSEREDKILYQILAVEKKFKTQGEWIFVSKELFLRGDLRTYKSAKSSRERWFNHIDPSLTKEWTAAEDQIMLEFVKKEGKKWAYISNKLNHAKNQHMIKNRFYSLLKKQQKTSKEELQEEQIISKILKRLKSQTINPSKNVEQPKKIKVQFKQKSTNNLKQVKQSDFQMKLITSYQYHQPYANTKDPNENQFSFIPNNLNDLDTSRFFKQQHQQKGPKASQLLKMSQSLAYNNIAYPSPVPVTPGGDLNLFNENFSIEPSFKGNFKFNLHDFVNKKAQ